MLNNHFIVRQCEHLAERVSHRRKDWTQISSAVPTRFGSRDRRRQRRTIWLITPPNTGMANVCRLILNSNEFMFVN